MNTKASQSKDPHKQARPGSRCFSSTHEIVKTSSASRKNIWSWTTHIATNVNNETHHVTPAKLNNIVQPKKIHSIAQSDLTTGLTPITSTGLRPDAIAEEDVTEESNTERKQSHGWTKPNSETKE